MPSIKGTASISSSSAQTKLLRTTKFPSSFSQKVDLTKVNASVLSLWIESEIESILGFEDEIVSSMAINLFFPKVKTDDGDTNEYGQVDPRVAQLDLVGFLGEGEAGKFVEELWGMMLDAQSQPKGIPRILIEKKKAEIAAQRAAEDAKAKNSSSAAAGGAGSSSVNPLVAEAAKRAEAARRALGHNNSNNGGRRDWNRHNNNNYYRGGERRNGPRPVSPQVGGGSSVSGGSPQYKRDYGRGRDDGRKMPPNEMGKHSSSRGRNTNRYDRDRQEDDRDWDRKEELSEEEDAMVVAATVRVGTGEEKKIKMTVVRMVEGGAENMVSGDGGRVRDPDPGRVPETGLGIVRVGITAMGGGTMDHQVMTKTVGDHTRENLPPREGATVDVMEVPQNEQAREIDLGAEVGVGARAGAGAIVVIGVEVKILILIPAIEIHEGLIHHLFRDIK
eukprot:CAMPEP_0203669486 /NCGR_PEP_ID=MMETSP0090-20130426/5852_1 /ASSEMBLY_ACC=CAM_ASM_001088 /TAXON_ID=426623 /ORGANISM="Chaetoceros affinis, Strain CCMP159" /LENGTH=445 /DNA_ID=CAMNT_0050534189 /DNA_START=53 /DNA_END=1391 /DNA_ORIENTATION=-